MPSPIVHSAAGLAIAELLFGPPRTPRDQLIRFGVGLVAANAPDLDFLPGILVGDPVRFHHGSAHSALAAVLAGCAAALVTRRLGSRNAIRFGWLVGLSYFSHLVLDMFASTVDYRNGVALAWPFSGAHFSFPFRLFIGIKLEPEHAGFVTGLLHEHNYRAVTYEVAIVTAGWVLVSLTARWWRRRQRPTRT